MKERILLYTAPDSIFKAQSTSTYHHIAFSSFPFILSSKQSESLSHGLP